MSNARRRATRGIGAVLGLLLVIALLFGAKTYLLVRRVDLACAALGKAGNVLGLEASGFTDEIAGLTAAGARECEGGDTAEMHGAFTEVLVPFGVYGCAFSFDPCTGRTLAPPSTSLVTADE